MKWKTKPDKPPENPNQPRTVEVDGAGLIALVARADQLQRVSGEWQVVKGEFTITALEPFGPHTGNGGRNGQYRAELHWHTLEQATLL